MPIGLQSKLLRVLQEKSVTPIGSQTDIPVDVRVIATTNRDMASEIQNGRFREDLYYRLNVFPLMTSCLADRPGDILPISTVLLKRHSADLSGIPLLDDSAVAMLSSYDWPGNVRELENVLQRALVLMTGQTITATEIVMDNALQNINTLAGKTQIEPRQLMQQGA
jgi:two-component system response regulator FlrC